MNYSQFLIDAIVLLSIISLAIAPLALRRFASKA
ncbi:hypothetical protein MAQ5080_02555 [Marinomonas aquimarina]|uniref:Uncharacterized protein n=1 Tax=Marinomonas aquimarina TaxID=295068 RepID=A0A1A8TKT9_9GAMM|nr:hypothetical protein MAQ5080_02555 [Marinomonas aquimarina]